MIGKSAIGHARHYRLGDALLFEKIYLHSLTVNSQSSHPMVKTITKLRDEGIVVEIPEELDTSEVREAYPIDMSQPTDLDADMLFARLTDSVLDSTVRYASLALRGDGRSCTLLVDELALSRLKSEKTQAAEIIRIEMLRVVPSDDTPAEMLIEMRSDPAVNLCSQLIYSFFDEVAKGGFNTESVERYVQVLDAQRKLLENFHRASFEKDSIVLYVADGVAINTASLQTVEPYSQMLSASLATISVFPPELDLCGAPLALVR